MKNRWIWWLGATAVALALAMIAPMAGGSINLGVALRDFSFNGNHTSPDGLIFWQTRVPRVLAGLLAGAALACSGVAFQAVLRNPLADPYILGVSSGAAMGKALAVLALPAAWAAGGLNTSFFCFFGGLIPTLVLARMARGQQRFSPVTLLLAGTMISLVLSAGMMLVQVFANPDDARKITYWWLGGLDITGYEAPLMALPPIVLGIGTLIFRARSMNLLSVDTVTASHLGVDVEREVRWLLGSGTLLAAVAVTLCGPIGFVGLLVPHILRLAAGADHRLLVPLCAFGGAAFLVACDLIGWRLLEWLASAGITLRSTSEIPAGVITALLGGPLFLWLLGRNGRG